MGLQVVALNSREASTKAGEVEAYINDIQVTFDCGFEEPANTYAQLVAAFPGANPFPAVAIVGKDGTLRYADHEYDPEAMDIVIQQALAE